MINLVEDIKKLVRNDREHNVKIEIDTYGIKIYLAYDSERIYEENAIIPIEYTLLEEFAFISDSDYRKMFNPTDFGINLNEIRLIHNIMEYIESNKEEINKLCLGLDLNFRDNENEN